MNDVLYIISVILFFLLPPALLAVHAFFPRYLPWWVVMAGVIVGGWVLVNTAFFYYFCYLDDLARATPNSSQALMEQWAAQGDLQWMALLFGWLYSIFYFLPWLLVCEIINGIAGCRWPAPSLKHGFEVQPPKESP